MENINIQLAIDEEVAEDFRDSFAAHYKVISYCVMELGSNPESQKHLDEIFRSLHSIKGNANMCQLNELTQIAHALENAMSPLRESTASFTPARGEILLLSLDKIRDISEELFEDEPVDTELVEKMTTCLHELQMATDDAEFTMLANDFVYLIVGNVIEENSLSIEENNYAGDDFDLPKNSDTVVHVTDNKLKESLNYFCHLAGMLDTKLPFRKGRIQRTLHLALKINDSIDDPADPTQLEGAIYMHDIAFAFFSEGMTLTDATFTEEDTQKIHTHPRIAADFMRQIPGWGDAAKMVWQHHEWWNGKGYPKGIQGEEICTGARILAVVDAYESMTHPRPDRQYKRSVIRAITEINNCDGKQFSPEVTKEFNVIVRQMLANRK